MAKSVKTFALLAILTVASVLLALFARSELANENRDVRGCGGVPTLQPACPISYISLLGQPVTFEAKRVLFTARLSMDDREVVFFPDEEHRQRGDRMTSIRLIADHEKIVGVWRTHANQYVRVEGLFRQEIEQPNRRSRFGTISGVELSALIGQPEMSTKEDMPVIDVR